jgi:ATP-binding cassette subfamily B protein
MTESAVHEAVLEAKEGEAGWRVRLDAGRQICSILYRADPRRTVIAGVLATLTAVVGPISSLLQGRLIDAVVAHKTETAVVAAVVMGLLALGASAGQSIAFRLRMRMREVGGHALLQHSAKTVSSVPGIEHLERPDVADRVEQLTNAQVMLAGLVDAVIVNIARVVAAVVTVVILASVSPWFGLLILFGAPTLWAGTREQKSEVALEERLTPDSRRMWLLRYVLETPEPAGEVRVFGLSRELSRRHHGLWADSDRQQTAVGLRNQLLTSGAWLVFAAGYLGALAMVIAQAYRGQASVGDVVIITTLGAQTRGVLVSLVEMSAWMVSVLRHSERFAFVEAVAARAARSTATDETGELPPDRLGHGIDLVDVTFRYPGTEVDVLRDVTIHLPAGSTVAIVGDNGAGKSTLVKLLARFYEPTSGAILVDGVPLRHFGVESWRDRLSAGFQDYGRLQFLATDSIGVGDHRVLGTDQAEPAVLSSMERASAQELLDDLPHGLATQLGTGFDDGIELSGGQWQKVALSRSMMRERPLLLLLDEPTAALDARAEHELFERYAGAADGAAATVSGITLLVSHRFSTVREADLILVVDGCTIAASGSHQELMAQQGLYAELYELQARAYR